MPNRALIVLGVLGCAACGAGFVSPSGVKADIRAINANPAAFVGQTIEVQGRIHVETYQSLEPCSETDPRCGWPLATTLHVVTAGEPRTVANSLDLYQAGPLGTFVAARCRIVSQTVFDCGTFAKDTMTTVRGRFVKDRQPVQTVGPGGGPPTVLQYKDVYFLVVTR